MRMKLTLTSLTCCLVKVMLEMKDLGLFFFFFLFPLPPHQDEEAS